MRRVAVLAAAPVTVMVPDEERTGICLVNTDDTDISYISDRRAGLTIATGWPIYPHTYVSITKKKGWKVDGVLFVIGSADHSLAVYETYGVIPDSEEATETRSPQER